MATTTTRKAVKVIGKETYINQQTGEIQEMQVINIEERDANFHKLWLSHIIQAIDLMGNQKIKFAFWLLEQMNSENQITMTIRQMSDKGNVSLQTASRAIKALVDSDFLVKVNMGVYQVNPDVIFKGGKGNRMNVMLSYMDTRAENAREENQESKSLPSREEPTPAGESKELQSHEDYIRIAKITNKKLGWAYFQAKEKDFEILDKEVAQELYDSITV